jgi:hypothetical protein
VSNRLLLEPRIACPDDTYAALIEMHRGLTDDQSQRANARLILLLANHIGDPRVIAEAATIARMDVRFSPEAPEG